MSDRNAGSEEWCKSSFSGTSGECVEVRCRDGAVDVRHSLDPDGPVLTFTEREWSAFLDGVRRGEFGG